jgi:hypothetical protein
MTKDAAPTARFEATLQQAAGKKATGIETPEEIIEALGHGKRPPVRVEINGHEYRTTIGVMAGKHLIPVSAEVRKEAGVAAGDRVAVRLTVDASPRSIDIPKDLAEQFEAHPEARAFFAGLSNSMKRYHIDNINGAKADETRRRRIDKAIGLFLEGKTR